MKQTDRFVVVVILFAALASAAILERHTYAAAPTGHFKVFRIPTAGSDPRHITAQFQLSIAYRRIGNEAEAKEHADIYNRLLEDHKARTLGEDIRKK